eukprot:snap_masked-scaffold_26-processed-gene-1.41-mRNA-1 protein AED:1.00 eAED:1.00 QI:0/0/0/0/1/1/2/0/417
MENKEAVIDQHVFPHTQENKSKNFQRNIIFIFGSLFVVAVVAGVFTVAVGGESLLSSQQDKIGDVCSRASAGERVKAASFDYISVIFDVKPKERDCMAFMKAASRLSEAIATTENNYYRKAGLDYKFHEVCGVAGQNNPTMFKEGENIEDLVVAALLQPMDGERGMLGFANVCMINEKNGLPLAGVMVFDTADTALMDKLEILEFVILHEMMHVLGFGITWTLLIGPNGDLLSNFTVIEDKVFSYTDKGELIIHPENEPKYTGVEGVTEFENLSGKPEMFIPIQGAMIGGEAVFNESAGVGQSQLDGHLDSDTFENALMTYTLDEDFLPNFPLAAVSLGMLRDIGYTVDTSVADDYILPESREINSSSLRGSSKQHIDLSNDILRIDPVRLNLDGPTSLENIRSRKVYTLEEAINLL